MKTFINYLMEDDSAEGLIRSALKKIGLKVGRDISVSPYPNHVEMMIKSVDAFSKIDEIDRISRKISLDSVLSGNEVLVYFGVEYQLSSKIAKILQKIADKAIDSAGGKNRIEITDSVYARTMKNGKYTVGIIPNRKKIGNIDRNLIGNAIFDLIVQDMNYDIVKEFNLK